mgnify:FL=1
MWHLCPHHPQRLSCDLTSPFLLRFHTVGPVQFFENGAFGGPKMQLNPGDYPNLSVFTWLNWNDKISSYRRPAGMSIIFFDQANFQGEWWMDRGPSSNERASLENVVGTNWDNRVSSMKISE